MNSVNLEKYNFYVRMIDACLNKIINGIDDPLHTTIKYALMSGGKRMRPVLFLSMLNGYGRELTDDDYMFACALELIHTYSLVHDDLPEMDNDDFRRGKETVHKMYGHSLALLTGDALLNLAFEILSSLACKDKLYAEAMRHVSVCAGHHGMIGGQTMEFSINYDEINKESLVLIENLKTAKLIEACMVSAAIISNNSKEILFMVMFSSYFGCAFQIKDDLLEKTIDNKNILNYIDKEKANEELNKNINISMDFLLKSKADTSFVRDFCLSLLARSEG